MKLDPFNIPNSFNSGRETHRYQARFLPKTVRILREGYSVADFTSDLIAGLTVGLVALPLAMAFGIASGVTPQAGLYTAVVAGFLISALGGSRCQIGGPTGAFVVIVAGIIAKFGVSGLMMVTLMAGVLLILMGLTGLGSAVKFIPRPVVIGFTNGISVLIASTQIKDFLGLKMPGNPSEFVERMEAIGEHISSVHLPTAGLAAASLALILFWPYLTRRVPGTIIALFFTTVVTTLFGLPVETIGTKFGGIPTGLPQFSFPAFQPELIGTLLPSALTVALLAAIESLLSAVVADSLSGDKHDSNVELVAQGIANLATPFFGGIPATGAIARTATNIRSGAKTPIAGMIHAATLLLILLIAAPLARFIPLATLAAVLLIVAYNMGEWKEVGGILRLSKADKSVWAATFALTVLADLTVAVSVGMVLAALLYIHRVSQTTTVELVNTEYIEGGRPHLLQDKQIAPYITILGIQGPFLFGASEKLSEATGDLSRLGSIVILKLRYMTALDATGLHALDHLSARLHDAGKTLLLCGVREQPERLLRQASFLRHVGEENVLPDIECALGRAQEIQSGLGEAERLPTK